MMSYSNSTCHKGNIGESLFMAECFLRGLNVSIPFGNSRIYDLVVEGYSGKLYKVQIKMSKVRKFDALKKYQGKIDMFGFLCGDTWVIIPEKDLSEEEYNLSGFRVNLPKKQKYLERFDLFV